MRNFKLILLPLITLSVTSCGSHLRQDVADFIASFSYKKARDSVLKGHYIDESKGKYLGNDCYFYEEVIFDVTSKENFVYKHVYKTVNYGVYPNTDYVEEIVKSGDDYIYSKDGITNKLTYESAYTYTDKFFYTNYYKQTDRYNGGMYYGDMIKDDAIRQQNFVTIDQEARIYRYKIDKVKSPESDIVTSIDYSVNEIGMLLNLIDSAYSESDPTTYYTETISVEY